MYTVILRCGEQAGFLGVISGLLIAGKICLSQKNFLSAFKMITGNDLEGWVLLLGVEILLTVLAPE